MSDIKVFFVLPKTCNDAKEASRIMKQAFEACKGTIDDASWVKEADIRANSLKKTDFMVFEEFKGEVFENVKQSKSITSSHTLYEDLATLNSCSELPCLLTIGSSVVGPWCVLACIKGEKKIPKFSWPILNVAMHGTFVCCSFLTKTQKESVEERVKLMGGRYTASLVQDNTHLVTESVKSEKYLQAAEAGVKVMLPGWIEAVWEASGTSIVHCEDEEFAKYRCPPFHKLVVSCTGLTAAERMALGEKIKQHGGTLTPNMPIKSTDFLIVCGELGTTSEKYKTARKVKQIHCVTMAWVEDCIEKGYALSHKHYQVEKATSTPTKLGADMPNFSMISAIGDVASRTTVEETQDFNGRSMMPQTESAPRNSGNGAIDGLDLMEAKQAGPFLDGCSVYLVGFTAEEREKLSKILSLSGATRYDNYSDRLTHIIVGDKNCAEVKLLKAKNCSAAMVSIDWIATSMRRQEPCDEETFLVKLTAADQEMLGSPLGKKGLNLLMANTVRSEEFEAAHASQEPHHQDDQNEDVMQLYRQQLLLSQAKDTNVDEAFSNATETHDETEPCEVFLNQHFFVTSFQAAERTTAVNSIEYASGVVLVGKSAQNPDYIVAPQFITSDIETTCGQLVNQLWIEECVDANRLVEVSYYHRPLHVADRTLLSGCVVTVSSYVSQERKFLQDLIVELGGELQDKFARVTSEEKGVKASTHLVSMDASGKKYDAAIKWGLPVVNKDWLLECVRSGQRVSEQSFLLGAAKASLAQQHSKYFPTPNSVQKEPLSIVKTAKNQTVDNIPPTSTHTPVNKQLIAVRHQHAQPHDASPDSPLIDIDAMFADIRRQGLLRPRPSSLDQPEVASQTTPLAQKATDQKRDTSATPRTPTTQTTPQTPSGSLLCNGSYVETPDPNGIDAQYLQRFDPNLSSGSKKQLKRYFSRMPEFEPPVPVIPTERRLSTPLSEVKRRVWNKLLATPPEGKAARLAAEQENANVIEQKENTPVASQNTDQVLAENFKQLEQLIVESGSSKKEAHLHFSKAESDNNFAELNTSPKMTVAWCEDEDEVFAPPSKKKSLPPKALFKYNFIISGVSYAIREELSAQIEELGGEIVSHSEYDPACTHLICEKPGRSEKVLACMAAGKWIVHHSYIDKCVQSGGFCYVEEEEYEFGNPRSINNIPCSPSEESRYKAIYLSRKEVADNRRKRFENMNFIIVGAKRDQVGRIVKAGGGNVLDVTPPFDQAIEVNYCLLEPKSAVDHSLYFPLAQQGVPCLNMHFINDFLHKEMKTIADYILSPFAQFYSQ